MFASRSVVDDCQMSYKRFNVCDTVINYKFECIKMFLYDNVNKNIDKIIYISIYLRFKTLDFSYRSKYQIYIFTMVL